MSTRGHVLEPSKRTDTVSHRHSTVCKHSKKYNSVVFMTIQGLFMAYRVRTLLGVDLDSAVPKEKIAFIISAQKCHVFISKRLFHISNVPEPALR